MLQNTLRIIQIHKIFYVENGAWSGTYHNGEIFIHYTKKTLSGYKIDNSEHLGEK